MACTPPTKKRVTKLDIPSPRAHRCDLLEDDGEECGRVAVIEVVRVSDGCVWGRVCAHHERAPAIANAITGLIPQYRVCNLVWKNGAPSQ